LHRLLFGLEEELFINEPDRPNFQSLYYLARLVWSSPGKYYAHTHCNFTRGKDSHNGLMSGVEISTGTHDDKGRLVADLAQRRMALAAASDGLLVPLGHLLDLPEPTNVSGMHLHISGFPDFDRAYRSITYFLPLLTLLVANAPGYGNVYFGPSFRWAKSFAIGPLREDRKYRFQDLIISKRLGTLEIRAFDPVWDLQLIRLLLDCVEAVLQSDRSYPGSPEEYNRLRKIVAREGFVEELRPVYRALCELHPVPEELLLHPPAEAVWSLAQEHGNRGAYSALDQAYRGGSLQPRQLPPMHRNWLKVAAGLCGYSLPRLPYNIKKVFSEW
jgi:gamma-glutamyl:cysteine ligase YbdK (ATP-grasp superfamily)